MIRLLISNSTLFYIYLNLVAAINDGNKKLRTMISNRPLSVYQIKGEFGLASDTHWHDGKIWEKSTFFHLTKEKIDRVLSSIEASHQRKMFEYVTFIKAVSATF